MKKCSKCKKEYPATLKYFKPCKNRKSKLSSWCRDCKRKIDRIYSRNYRTKNPEWKKKR